MSFSNDSLDINKMLVVYREMGRLEEARHILHYMGILDDEGKPLTVDTLDAHAEACMDVWGVKNPDREMCYLCNHAQPKDRLCSCYWQAVINVTNSRELVNKFHERQLFCTYVCGDCRKFQKLYAKQLRHTMEKYPVYRLPELCMDCNKKRGARRSAPQPAVKGPIRGRDHLADLKAEVAAAAPDEAPQV